MGAAGRVKQSDASKRRIVAMSVRNLETLLHPRSIAVVGASSRPGALGQRILENLIDSGFEGTIFAVNPKRVELDDE